MNTINSQVTTKRVHVFKAGDQTSAQGVHRKFTPKELQEVVDTYDPGVHEAPLVIGHSGDNDSVPAYGWIKKFVRDGDNLYADVDFTDPAKELVKNKHYRKVSISFYSPDSQINPHKGKWSARHLALLGASPPAVKGLEPFTFSEEEGVLDFAAETSLDAVFDDDLGPTMIVEKSPLEMLKEKLEEARAELSPAVEELQQSSDEQSENNVSEAASPGAAADSSDNPNQQFSEMDKKEKRPGAKAAESTQQTANLETQMPEEPFAESGKIARKKAAGAHGQSVQVVEEIHKESDEDESQVAEFDEVSHKTVTNGKVKFGTHHVDDSTDDTGRGDTARSKDDSYADRQAVGKDGAGAVGVDREGVAKSGAQEADRIGSDEKSVKSGEQDADRDKAGKDGHAVKSAEGVGEDRWAGQEETGGKRAMENDQYAKPDVGLNDVSQPGVSSGTDPYGKDEGATKVPTISEESPDNLEMAVDLESVEGNKTVRVMRQTSGQKRAPVKGGAIDHAEAKKIKTLSGEVDEETDEKDPMTPTGKGSTYAESKDEEEGEDAEFTETQDFCGPGMSYGGMGSTNQAPPVGMGQQLFEELQALKAENARLKRDYQEQQISARRDKIARFVENLYAEGKMTDGVMPQSALQHYCEGLEFGTLEFAEGETPATKLLDLLDKLPNLVYFGEVAVGAGANNLDDEDLSPHELALKYVENGECEDYTEGLKKAMFGRTK